MSAGDNVPRRLPTGIAGLDQIMLGGLPAERPTLLSGTAGGGKTVFALQFLSEGIRQFNEPGVFVTFEESTGDLRQSGASLGFDIQGWEDEGLWVFVDAAPVPTEDDMVVGSYDFGALVARIDHAVKRIGAKRVCLDSLGAVYDRFRDPSTVRLELFKVASALKAMGVTSLLTVERPEEFGPISRLGVEEFVADNVLVLRNVLEREKRRRTIEVLKFRGQPHRSGEWLFTIVDGEGIVVIPISLMALRPHASEERVTTGNDVLDRMCSGGFYRDSVVIVSGPTGSGKTLMTSEFVAAGAASGERCVLLSFEESLEQLMRNAGSWGIDLAALVRTGKLKIMCEYPEVASLEDHFVAMKDVIEEFDPQRVAIDNLSALERISTGRGIRDFIIGLASFLKQKEITSLITSTTTTLLGGPSVTESHISTLADGIILLRYVEYQSEVRRGVVVLKMRGAAHDKQILEYTIDDDGLHIGEPFHGLSGILGLTRSVSAELEFGGPSNLG
jgi:circadian clock protein KaiC